MTKTNKTVLILGCIAFIWILVVLFVMIFADRSKAQEITRYASWSNSKTIDLGNGHKRFEMIMARSYYVEYEKDINGNMIAIRNISGNDTISYLPSNFSQYYGGVVNGNYEDNYISSFVDSNVTKVNIYNDFDVATDTVLVYSKEKVVAKSFNIAVFDKDNKKLNINKVEKDGNKVKITANGKIKTVDPTWSWQPNGIGKDATVRISAPTTNYGTTTRIEVEYDGNLSTDIYLGMLQFVGWRDSIKLSQPTFNDSWVNSIMDCVYVYENLGTSTYQPYMKKIDSLWTESTVTYNTRPRMSTTDSTTPMTARGDTGLFYGYDVTNMFKTKTDSGAYLTVVYQALANATYHYAYSSDYAGVVKRPKRYVDYTVGGSSAVTYQGYQPLYDGKYLPLYNNGFVPIYRKP
jgi:hypothetical protein